MQVKTYGLYLDLDLARNRLELPNGREIVDVYYSALADWGVVLAFQGENDAAPWVTWEFYRGDLATTAAGHYFKTRQQAYRDFADRIDCVDSDAEVFRERAEEQKLRAV